VCVCVCVCVGVCVFVGHVHWVNIPYSILIN